MTAETTNNRTTKRMSTLWTSGFIFLVVAAFYLLGGLRFVDDKLLEAHFSLDEKNATSNLVIVTMDADSLDELGTWPWPRSYHARVLDALIDAGAVRVAFDVDFSSTSIPEEDAAFEKALARAGPRAILAVLKQRRHGQIGEGAILFTEPLPQFRDKVSLASVSMRPNADGVVRRSQSHEPWKDDRVPFIATQLAGLENEPSKTFYVDFGIRPDTIPSISYADIMAGRFDPALIAGKSVIVGTTAVQLGDLLSVPSWGILPGVQVIALAYESMVQGRTLYRLGSPFVLAIAAVFILGFGTMYAGWNWRKGLLWLTVTSVAVLGATVVAHQQCIILDSSAILVAITLCFVSGVIRRSGWKSLHIRKQGVEIKDKDTMMKGVVENSFDAILILDDTGLIRDANPAAHEIIGTAAYTGQGNGEIDGDGLAGQPVGNFIPGATRLILREGAAPRPASANHIHEMTAQRMDGSEFPVEIAMREMTTASARWHIAFVRDITDRKAHEHALEHQALHDALTGLPNRTYLYKRLQEYIARAPQSGERFALLLLDLNRFKEINDTLGHHIGDVLLQQIAKRLSTPLRDTDMIARLGGDEFAILFAPAPDRHAVEKLASRLERALEEPLQCNGLILDVGASIGVSVFPDDGSEATELIQRADVAMYLAKNSGLPVAFYDADLDQNSVRHLTLTGELKRAIEGEELELHFQPKISVATQDVVSVECLARWAHPELGAIPAEEFIELAEQTGMIRDLTTWALKTAIKQSAQWRAKGIDLDVAVNLSAKILRNQELPDLINRLLKEHGVSPDHLVLEITESAIMVDSERAKAVIDQLAENGFKLSIDDFGTGYSSLAYLKELPVRELKIDKSFVLNLAEDVNDQVIVNSTINLAHNLGLKVVAEGVENVESLALLADMGCDVAQGWFVSKALAPGDFDAWLEQWQNSRVDPQHQATRSYHENVVPLVQNRDRQDAGMDATEKEPMETVI